MLHAGSASQEWIVARSLCAYTTFDCSQVPAKRRAGFLDIAVRRWAPFADPDYHVAWSGGMAMVWAWSRACLADPATPGQVPSEGDRGLPESMFLGAPQAAGESLQACVEGVEGRVWRDHVLVASQWWPQAPDRAQWNWFLRGAGAGVVDAPPPVQELPRQAAPWASPGRRSFEDVGRRLQRPALLAAALAGVFVFAWQLGGFLPLAWRHFAIQSDIAALEPGLQPILQARESADRDAARITELLALRPAASQSRLMAEVGALLPARGVNVTQWKYDDRQGLEVMVRANPTDPQPLVQALEESAWFGEASAEPGDGADRIRLRARVEAPSAEPAP